MVRFYTGVPGSGKSLHAAEVMQTVLINGCNLITNVRLDIANKRRKTYLDLK
ncbi:MAG: zonular occludens toxin domain-containing protein [Defluviitaleaceae bacterium]|nr:zonular occludens toxin domain-containing protein [Defluviitaleaceae bacterium]